jgi:hypothetical protein
MQSLPQPDNRLYLGKGGSGKTTLALCHSHDFARVIICNPNAEDQHEEGADVTDDRAELVQLAAQRGPWRIAWRFTKTGNAVGFDWVNRVAWAAGDCCIVWDEADLFMRHGTMPDAAYQLWNVGRHHRVRIFACSRRPARVSRDVTANLSRACVFRTQEPTDIDFLGEFMERSAADAVKQLQPFHAVDWTQQGWAVKKSLFR